MLDIIFISYDEPDADANYQRLVDRFPHARRVHGVKGIANAHMAAAKKAMTRFFYVVDADAVIRADFSFSFVPRPGEEDYVHIWNAANPIGLVYGYGGVKLFSKKFFREIKSHVDFSTTLTKDVKFHKEIACDTYFNSDYLRAFRGAFREAAKLITTCKDQTKSPEIRSEAEYRLSKWMSPESCAFRDFIIEGAKAGVEHVEKNADLMFINEHALITEELTKRYPNFDIASDATPKDQQMKHEFFFTTRIASALYDQTVVTTLPLTELRDAISDGQLLSKNWLIEELRKLELSEKPRVAILGGWIGTLALLINTYEFNASITSIDMDPRANRIAEKLNYDFDFKTKTMDMYHVDYSDYDVIINTSSEHIPDIPKWRAGIPSGKIVIVQNNNFEAGEGHVSCVRNSHELKDKLRLAEVFYEGTRKFPAYNRFMLIGKT